MFCRSNFWVILSSSLVQSLKTHEHLHGNTHPSVVSVCHRPNILDLVLEVAHNQVILNCFPQSNRSEKYSDPSTMVDRSSSLLWLER